MPAVTTLHEDSESNSRPSFFRGHQWGCLSLLTSPKCFAIGLWATIQAGLEAEKSDGTRGTLSTQLVQMAQNFADTVKRNTYLILDAFFAVGPVLTRATNRVQILTRAKKNIVAYESPKKPRKKKPGRPRKYGRKVKLMKWFKTRPHLFLSADATLYGITETVQFFTANLIWRPVGKTLRFILVQSSRGSMILISSELTLDPIVAIEMYSRRVMIESLFDILKNIFGGMAYHFWSKSLQPISRRPVKNEPHIRTCANSAKAQQALKAIHRFVNLHLIIIGFVQILALRSPKLIWHKADCWLRTYSSNTPSAFVTRQALANILRKNIFGFEKNPITHFIRQRQTTLKYNKSLQNTG